MMPQYACKFHHFTYIACGVTLLAGARQMHKRALNGYALEPLHLIHLLQMGICKAAANDDDNDGGGSDNGDGDVDVDDNDVAYVDDDVTMC